MRSFCVGNLWQPLAASPNRPHWLSREMGPLAAQGTDPVIGGADHHAAPPSSSPALCPTISTAVAARACLLSALSALAVVDSVVVLSTSVKFCNFGRWLWPPYFISHSISDPDTCPQVSATLRSVKRVVASTPAAFATTLFFLPIISFLAATAHLATLT